MDEELGLGAKITLQDAFSGTAARVRGEFGRLHQSLRAGSSGLVQALGALTGQSSLVGFALGGPTGVAMGMHALIASTVETGGQIENLGFAFTQLLGNVDAAHDHIRTLQQFAVGKPFEFAQLAETSRTLQVFGYNVQETMGLLQTFGDTAFSAGTGFRGVQQMTRVFGTVLATGRITRGHLNTLVMSGVNAYDILRERLHLTDQQLQNIARSGIPARQIIQALQEGMNARYAGGMDRAMASLASKLSDINDQVTNFKSELYEAIGPTIIDVLDRFKNALTPESVTTFARVLGDVLSTVVRLVRILVAPITGAFGDLGARWERDGGRAVAPMRRFLGNVRDVIEGVAALVTSENSRGLSQIPRALRDKLVERGLWPLVQRIARWGDRVRAFLTGFIPGLIAGFQQVAAFAQGFARALGFQGLPASRAEAERYGRTLGTLLPKLLALKFAVVAVTAVLPALRAGLWMVGTAMQFALDHGGQARAGASLLHRTLLRMAATNPVLLAVVVAVLAIGAATLWAYRHADKLTSSAPKWRALRTVMGLVFGPFIEVAILLGRTDGALERLRGRVHHAGDVMRAVWTRVKNAVMTFGRAVWEVLWPVRIAVSMVALVVYVFLARAVGGIAVLARLYAGLWQRIGSAAASYGRTLILPFVLLWNWLRSAVGAFRTYMGFVGGQIATFFTQRFGRQINWLVARFRELVTVLRPIWAQIRVFFEDQFGQIGNAARTFFGNLAETLLLPLRMLAREILAAYNDLPAALRPGAMAGMVGTLERFAAGPGAPAAVAATRAAGDAATAGAPAVARATVQTGVLNTAAARAASTAPAQVVEVRPTPVTVPVTLQVDRRTLATAVATQNTDDQLRRGDSVPSGRGPMD